MHEIRLSDINPFCIVKDIVYNLWIVILCSIMAMMWTQVVLDDLYRPIYTSSATFYVSPKDSTYSAYYNLSVAYDMAVAICEVFESNIMASKVAESMGLDDLPATITAQVHEGTNLLHLQAKCSSPELAYRTVTAIIENHKQVSDFVFDNVVIDILDRPIIPASPSNQVSTSGMQKKAAVIAAFLALVLVAAFSVLRDTIKTDGALRYYLDTTLLGTIKHEAKNKTLKSRLKNINCSLLITNPVIGYAFSEAIKRLCTKLIHISNIRKHTIYLVTSASENEGKSTVSANLALGLAECGYKVLLMDCDLRKPSQHKIICKGLRPKKDFSEYLKRRASIDEVLMYDKASRLYLLLNYHSCPNPSDLLASVQMERLVNYYRSQMDYIIIDSPPMSVACDTEILAGYSDASLLVIRQDYSFVRRLNDTIATLRASGHFLGSIYNNVIETDLNGIGRRQGNYGKYYGKYYGKVG